jgi:hypothetical protein
MIVFTTPWLFIYNETEELNNLSGYDVSFINRIYSGKRDTLYRVERKYYYWEQ